MTEDVYTIMTEDAYTQMFWSLERLLPTMAFIALGIVAVVLFFRKKNNEIEKRSAIIQTVFEKGSGTVPEDLLKTLNSPNRGLKERLLGKLLWGIICSLIGIGLVVGSVGSFSIYKEYIEDVAELLVIGLVLGLVLFAVGAGLIAYYFIARHVLRNEISKEERMLKD